MRIYERELSDSEIEWLFNIAAAQYETCERPVGYKASSEFASTESDCVDNDDTVNPQANEICNGKDDNCDGLIDEDVETVFYRDSDGDRYGETREPV